MKRSAYVMLAGFWLCLSPSLQLYDGTLPLPQLESQQNVEPAAADSIWDLLCR